MHGSGGILDSLKPFAQTHPFLRVWRNISLLGVLSLLEYLGVHPWCGADFLEVDIDLELSQGLSVYRKPNGSLERNNYYQAGDKQRPRAQQQNYQRTNAAKGKTLKIDPKANDNTHKQLTVPKSDPASN